LRLERSNSKQVELVELSVVNEWMQQHNVEYVGLPSAPQLAQLIDR
jgi:tRNA isopentenyl-2-thiomethyl-A-37 hydroxylase MiaE